MSRVMRTIALWLIPAMIIEAQSPGLADEFELKTAFIHKMTHFVRWENENDWDKEVFLIEIYRQDKRLTRALKEGLKEKLIRERKVIIREIDNINESQGPQILVVGDVSKKEIDRLLKAQAKSLIVSDNPGVAERGVHINFIKKKNKIELEMNLSTLEQSGIQASSRVKQMATIVETKS